MICLNPHSTSSKIQTYPYRNEEFYADKNSAKKNQKFIFWDMRFEGNKI